jgi:hypothetical protein
MNDQPNPADHQSGASINIPEWDGRASQVSELWTLRKLAHVAVCSLWTHPIGGEIRVTVDGEMQRTEAKRDGLALVDLALDWRKQFRSERLDLIDLSAWKSAVVSDNGGA